MKKMRRKQTKLKQIIIKPQKKGKTKNCENNKITRNEKKREDQNRKIKAETREKWIIHGEGKK